MARLDPRDIELIADAVAERLANGQTSGSQNPSEPVHYSKGDKMNTPMGTTSCVMCGKETTWEVLPDWWHEQNMRLPRYCSLECFRAAIASIKTRSSEREEKEGK